MNYLNDIIEKQYKLFNYDIISYDITNFLTTNKIMVYDTIKYGCRTNKENKGKSILR